MSEYTDPCVRLEQYMAAEYGGERGWNVERCYMLREDYDRVMTLPEHKSNTQNYTRNYNTLRYNLKRKNRGGLRYGVPGFTLDFP